MKRALVLPLLLVFAALLLALWVWAGFYASPTTRGLTLGLTPIALALAYIYGTR